MEEESLIVGYNLLLNSMALAVEFGFYPYVGILPNGSFKVYWDFRNGRGKCKIYDNKEFEEAAAWMRDNVYDAAKDKNVSDRMHITNEERLMN